MEKELGKRARIQLPEGQHQADSASRWFHGVRYQEYSMLSQCRCLEDSFCFSKWAAIFGGGGVGLTNLNDFTRRKLIFMKLLTIIREHRNSCCVCFFSWWNICQGDSCLPICSLFAADKTAHRIHKYFIASGISTFICSILTGLKIKVTQLNSQGGMRFISMVFWIFPSITEQKITVSKDGHEWNRDGLPPKEKQNVEDKKRCPSEALWNNWIC